MKIPKVKKYEKDPARVKSGRKSRRKGKRGEFQARDLVQKLLYPKGDGKVERTPMSGAWHGTPIMTGDLVFLRNDKFDHDRYPLFFEVKNVRKASVAPFNLLKGDFGILATWMDEAAKKAEKGNLRPVLMWKVDFSEWFVVIPTSHFDGWENFSGFTKRYPLHLPRLQTSRFTLIPFKAFCAWLEPCVEHINENTRLL